jgi:uncharacterized membrane protein
MSLLITLVKGFAVRKRTAARTLATFHLFVMLAATALFLATWLAQRQGYLDGTGTTQGLILGIGAFALLVIGGTLGGALAYVYGVRVIKRAIPIADALIPGRLEESATRTAGSGARTDWTGWSVRN